MRMYDLIEKKKRNESLDEAEVRLWFGDSQKVQSRIIRCGHADGNLL